MELEVVLVKAIRLLHSKARDSTEQLRQLLEDSLHGQLNISPTVTASTLDQSGGSSSSSIKKASYNIGNTSKSLSASKNDVSGDVARKTAGTAKEDSNRLTKRPILSSSSGTSKETRPEKRTYDKLKQVDLFDVPSMEVAKRGRTESPKTILTIERSSPASTSTTTAASSPSSSSSSSTSIDKDALAGFEGNSTAADMAVEMGLVCLICRGFDVTSGNTLVECQECHGLYHQECHKPPITDQDVNDPRLVWYCAKCTKNMKKMVSKTQKSTSSGGTTLAATSSRNADTVLKATKKSSDSTVASSSASTITVQQTPVQIFKRLETKTTSTPGQQQSSLSSSSSSALSSGSSNKPIGLAGLAASLSGKSQKGNTTQSATSVQKQSSGDPKKTLKGLAVTQQPPVTLTLRSSTMAGLYTTVKPESQAGGNNGGTTGTSGTPTSIAKTSSSGQQMTSGSGNGGNGSSTNNAAALLKSAAGGTGAGSSSLMSADKRLQIMKKKAAAKMQEKRRMSNK